MIDLKPASLWNFFHQITQIPRPSKKEAEIAAFLVNFAKKHSLQYKQDQAGNIVILKDAVPGYENHPVVILQAHMDMVCEKNSGTVHDFDKDPIRTFIDGDWVKAKGTTLGADNGIGMAMMLAVLASAGMKHPALECLFTVDEETGLTGAIALGTDVLSGSTLINLDSEDDGQIFIGCAGGIGTRAFFDFKEELCPGGDFGFKVTVSGLKGGHSGGDIHLGLANAVKILGDFLWQVNRKMDLRLVAFEGGNLHNAIPREATAFAVIPYQEKENIRVLLNVFISEMECVFAGIEPDMAIALASESLPATVMPADFSRKLLNVLCACPHGVVAMSKDIPGLVETSTNLASVKQISAGRLEINTSQRSSSDIAKRNIASRVFAVFDLAGAEVLQSDGYPGWTPNLNSAVLKVASESYMKLFGEMPEVKAIHAGLECGLFLEKYPQLDMISIGPQMYGVHSPDERLSISSTQKTWEWLADILESI